MQVQKLLNLFEFIRTIESEIPAQHIHAWLVVAADGPISMGRVADKIGMTKATLTRILDKLSSKGVSDKSGLSLIKAERDPQDDRFVLLSLTSKGETLLKNMNKIIGG